VLLFLRRAAIASSDFDLAAAASTSPSAATSTSSPLVRRLPLPPTRQSRLQIQRPRLQIQRHNDLNLTSGGATTSSCSGGLLHQACRRRLPGSAAVWCGRRGSSKSTSSSCSGGLVVVLVVVGRRWQRVAVGRRQQWAQALGSFVFYSFQKFIGESLKVLTTHHCHEPELRLTAKGCLPAKRRLLTAMKLFSVVNGGRGLPC
jgi:hypothetical protein